MFKRIFGVFITYLIFISCSTAFAKNSTVISAHSTATNTPQKVRLASFHGAQLGDAIILQWTLTKEDQQSDIIIERSTDGTNFSEIKTLKPSEGHQAFTDANPPAAAMYRLRFISGEGHTEYSPSISFFSSEISNGADKVAVK